MESSGESVDKSNEEQSALRDSVMSEQEVTPSDTSHSKGHSEKVQLEESEQKATDSETLKEMHLEKDVKVTEDRCEHSVSSKSDEMDLTFKEKPSASIEMNAVVDMEKNSQLTDQEISTCKLDTGSSTYIPVNTDKEGSSQILQNCTAGMEKWEKVGEVNTTIETDIEKEIEKDIPSKSDVSACVESYNNEKHGESEEIQSEKSSVVDEKATSEIEKAEITNSEGENTSITVASCIDTVESKDDPQNENGAVLSQQTTYTEASTIDKKDLITESNLESAYFKSTEFGISASEKTMSQPIVSCVCDEINSVGTDQAMETNPVYSRSESKGFEVDTEEKIETNDSESVVSSSKSEENSYRGETGSFEKLEKISTNGSVDQMEVDNSPSPYPESEMSEIVGPQTPSSLNSMADSTIAQVYESMGPPTPTSSAADSTSLGPTPLKRCRTGINTNETPTTANTLYEYQWPQDETGEFCMLQEQISEYLHVKSFKRKYPDLFRRQVDIKERVYLLEKGAVSETQADLGLTALKSDEVYDLMMKDYPTKYQEYLQVVHEKQKQKINEKHKEYGVPKLEKGKMTQYIKKAMKSASEWNSHFLKERREERRAYLDLQTFNIHYPVGRYKALPPEATKISAYPVALIPGQYQDYHKKYSPAELKYFPLNTALFNPPKRMNNTLANPKDIVEGETASEEDTNATGSESDSDDSSSGSDNSSQKEENEEKKDSKGETKEAAPSDIDMCRICELGKNADVKGQDDFVCCSECKKVGHPSCLDLTGEMVTVVKTYPWQCMDCKTCVECMDPYDEDKMMFCDLCDRGYHTFCVGLKNIPNGRWKCRSCKGPETIKTPRSTSKTKRGKGGRGKNKGGTVSDPATPTGRPQATPTPPPVSSEAPSPMSVPVEENKK